MKRDLKSINQIIIHCSDSRFGDAKEIDRWHRGRGWRGIGYHHVITNGILKHGDDYNPDHDGLIQDGRELADVGAHCRGHNEMSIGICLIGTTYFTVAQMERLKWLVWLYVARFNIPAERVVGHCEFDNGKTCPNFDVNEIRDYLRRL